MHAINWGSQLVDELNQLSRLCKQKSKGYSSTKAEPFTEQNVKDFLSKAEDTTILQLKVFLSIGYYAAMRCGELVQLCVGNLTILPNRISIDIKAIKTKTGRDANAEWFIPNVGAPDSNPYLSTTSYPSPAFLTSLSYLPLSRGPQQGWWWCHGREAAALRAHHQGGLLRQPALRQEHHLQVPLRGPPPLPFLLLHSPHLS